MNRRAAWTIQIALAALAVALGIAYLLQRFVGWHGEPPRFHTDHWPYVGRRFGPHTVELLWPRALWLAVFVPVFGLAVGASLADLPRAQRWLGVGVRALLALALVGALSHPSSTTTSQRVATVFLVDVSDSVPDEALGDFHAVLDSAVAQRGDNAVRLITFARRPRVIELPEHLAPGAHLAPFERHDLPPGAAPPPGQARTGAGAGTDLAAALSMSYGLFPPGYLRRVVVLSDGVQTDGDALSETERANRFGVRVSVVPSRRGAPPEIAVRELRLPERIRVNEPFDVRATVFASRGGRAHATLMQSEAVNGLDGPRDVDLVPGDNEVRFRSVVRTTGDVTYALTLDPGRTPDRFRENNRFVTTASVPGPPSVLYVEGDPTRASFFRDALAEGDFEVEVRSGREFPQTLSEMQRFDFIVLSDVAAADVSLGAQQALTRYVRDLGGGFMMAGGPRSFGLGGWQGTEVERLLPVRLEGERRRDQPSLALSLVIDRSGSMQGLPLELAKRASLAAAQYLGPEDYLEVIGFDSEAERVVQMQSAANRVRIANDISRLRPGGGTNIFPALDAAFQDLQVTHAVTKHVILLTDGQAPTEGLHELVLSMVAEGITVSTVGLGTQVDRPLLENLGRVWGGGRTYFTADPNNLPQLFLRETQTVARNSVVDEPVQPRVATSAGFMRGIDAASMPLLMAYVSTRARPDPAQTLLETDTDPPEPLLARWRVGLGWSLAWTSDIKNRWAFEWIRWPHWREFWSQLVREHMRTRRTHELGIRAEMVAGNVHVAVDAIGPDDRFENGLDSSVTITGPQPHGTSTTVPMREIAPGRYEADFPLDRYGAFALHAVHRRGGQQVAESDGQINNPYPREYAALEPDAELLARLARATGGRVDPAPGVMFDAQGETISEVRALWRYPVMAAIGLLVLDILLRRVRIFDRGFKPVRPSRAH